MDVEVKLKKSQVGFFDGVNQFDYGMRIIFDEWGQCFRQPFVQIVAEIVLLQHRLNSSMNTVRAASP